MRAFTKAYVLFVFVAVVGGSAEAGKELDAPKADPKHHRVEFENDWVRVIRFRIPPHEKTALHDHPSVVVLYLTDGDLKVTTPDGKVSEAHPKAGAAGWRGPIAHTVENIGAKPVEGIGVEPKGAGNAAWTPPTLDAVRVNPHDKMEFENDQVRIIRVTVGKGESAPMHEHPAGVQILLTDLHVRVTTPDGKTTEASRKAGEVGYSPPRAHSVENVGERFEEVIVDLKGAPSKTAGR